MAKKKKKKVNPLTFKRHIVAVRLTQNQLESLTKLSNILGEPLSVVMRMALVHYLEFQLSP